MKREIWYIGIAALTLLMLPIKGDARADWHHGWHGGYRGGFGGIGGGFLGGIAGGVVGGWLSRPAAPQTVIVAPQPAPVPEMALQPWTPAWYTSCGQRYQTFDPHTGYYLGVDGLKYFCQ